MAELTGIRLRIANEADLDAILAIEEISFTTAWSRDFFFHELHNPISKFYVLEQRKCVIGYVIFWLVADEVHIANLAVHPQFRRSGMGTKLLKTVFDQASRHRAKIITLEVNEKNVSARDLYRKFGFAQVGRRAKYYENRDDALILSRSLQ